MSWFSKVVEGPVRYKIVELFKPRTRLGGGAEVRESVASLAAHPGFLWLIGQLDAQNSMLRTKLVADRHKELKDVEFLQSGIYWSQWLQDMINRATMKLSRAQSDATVEETEAFNQLQSAIEKIE